MALRKAPRQLVRERDAAVPATRAADRDREVALSFRPIVRNEERQQRLEALEELLRALPLQDPARHARVGSGMRFQSLDEVGIRQEAHVEDEVARGRNAVTVTEADERHVER